MNPDNRFRIVFVSHDAGRAGAQRYLIALIRWLRDECDIEPKIVLRRGGPLIPDFAELGPVLEIEPLLQRERKALKDGLLDFCHEADLIYINTLVPGDIAEMLSELDIPIVTHAHEMEQAIGRWCSPEHLQRILKVSDHIVAASPAVAENLINRHGQDQARISTVYSFIESTHERRCEERERLSKGTEGLAKGSFVVFGCGTMEWRKGVDLFLQVARIAIEDLRLSNTYFYWIGAETPEFRQKDVTTLIRALGLQSRVFLLGEVNDPREYFAGGDLFLLTSREDPFPLVCLEAADMGLSIVCFDEAGGMPDFVKDDAGFVVPFCDVRAMAEKVALLKSDPQRRNLAGAVALQRVRSEYSTSVGATKILNALLRQAYVHSRGKAPILNRQVEELISLRQDLTKRVSDLEGLVAARDRELARKHTEATQIHEQLAAFGQEKRHLTTALADKETELNQNVDRLTELIARVSELQTEVTIKDSSLADAEAIVMRLSEEADERRTRVEALEDQLLVKGATIAQQESHIEAIATRSFQEKSELRSRVDALEGELSAKGALITQQESHLRDLRRQLEDRAAFLTELQNEVSAKSAEIAVINEVHSGVLWKLFVAVRQFKDGCLPPETGRRKFYDRCLTAAKAFVKPSQRGSYPVIPFFQKPANPPSGQTVDVAVEGHSLTASSPVDSEKLFFAIDSVAVRASRVYGWGWVFHRVGAISAVRLGVNLGGEVQYFPCQYGIHRQDVADNHRCDNARRSGFLIQCRLPAGLIVDMFLEIDIEGLRTCRLDAELFRVVLGKDSRMGTSDRMQKLRRYSKKSLEHLARGDLRSLYKKTRRKIEFIRETNESAIFDFDEFPSSVENIKNRSFTLLVDHNMGGGTNQYRNRLIQERLLKEQPVLLLTYDVWRLRYSLKLYDREREVAFRLESLDSLNRLASVVTIREIFLNNVVSFEDPLLILTLLTHLKEETGAELVFAVHDYFAVCPSWTLLDDSGRFCGIPALERCRQCLPRLSNVLSFWVESQNIDQWRTVWARYLGQADCILAFSRKSIELLCRAFPDLDRGKMRHEPHSMDDFTAQNIPVDAEQPLHIGIVGEISVAKGAQIVRQMAELVERRRLPVKITVIGTIEGGCATSLVRVTGPYQRRDLVEAIRNSGANVFFVPAIWPETFSYVTAELMSLGLPVASFNLGAQAERLAAYDRGLVIDEATSQSALDALMAFHAKLQGSQPGANPML